MRAPGGFEEQELEEPEEEEENDGYGPLNGPDSPSFRLPSLMSAPTISTRVNQLLDDLPRPRVPAYAEPPALPVLRPLPSSAWPPIPPPSNVANAAWSNQIKGSDSEQERASDDESEVDSLGGFRGLGKTGYEEYGPTIFKPHATLSFAGSRSTRRDEIDSSFLDGPQAALVKSIRFGRDFSIEE